MLSKRGMVPAALLGVICLYGVALLLGWPQLGTRQIVAQQPAHAAAPADGDAAHADAAPADADTEHADSDAEHASGPPPAPPFWTVIPFLLLLTAIAVLPVVPATAHWWESNLNRLKVAVGLAVLTLAYYAFLHESAIEGHWPAHHVVAPAEGDTRTDVVNTVLANALLQEFVPFIVLLFSLYAISGGIRIVW